MQQGGIDSTYNSSNLKYTNTSSYSNAGHGEFGGWNTQNGTQSSELISQNQSRFDHDRQSGQMDFRLPNEKEQHALNKLAGDDPAKQRELLSAACAMIKCSAEFAYGSDERAYYQALEAEGAQNTDAQTVLKNYHESYVQQGNSYPVAETVVIKDQFGYGAIDRLSDSETLAMNNLIASMAENLNLSEAQTATLVASLGLVVGVSSGKISVGKLKWPGKQGTKPQTETHVQGSAEHKTFDPIQEEIDALNKIGKSQRERMGLPERGGLPQNGVEVSNNNARQLLESRGATPDQARDTVTSFEGEIKATPGKAGDKFVITETEIGSGSGRFVTRESAGSTPTERIENLALPKTNTAEIENDVVLGSDQVLLEGRVKGQQDQPWAHKNAVGGGHQVVTNGDIVRIVGESN
ncbi:hypothetical protein [Photobacterium halotolerans]|uniref:Uncharacterized protein n=1 Tax=Photobacterium halotolerans TaxID=265726 RepID=A0A0F5VBF0_9GAMM|nr:hypothetical protein [Photobacterium halotolerans]KKC99500.1 hypothetical protein KY46_12695 [Photobacterium halotolerans]